MELSAFRITQQAVRYTLRHARAHRLQVTVAFGADELGLAVADEGAACAR